MNELILRLVKDDRIVGYQVQKEGKIWHLQIPHDTIELGIRIGDKIVFEGDIVEDTYNKRGTVLFDRITFTWILQYGDYQEFLFMDIKNMEVIGNIHDNPEMRGEYGKYK